jgi:hypothetical protein
MTVAPSTAQQVTPPSPAESTSADPLAGLGEDLQHRLRLAAAASGMTLTALVEQWLREGLERFEAHHPLDEADGSGRCSLRTGTCSLGPVPLPVQQ